MTEPRDPALRRAVLDRFDPDPLYVDEESYDVGYHDGVVDGTRLRPLNVAALVLVGCIIGAAVTLAWVNVVEAAAPRPVQAAIPAASTGSGAGAPARGQLEGKDEASGNLPGPTGAPTAASRSGPVANDAPPKPSAGAPYPPVVGIASWVTPRLGASYLALPGGPGSRVIICGRHACIRRTSTDAGPARFLQRQGRVADLSKRDFARICGCSPERAGLTPVRVFYLDFDPTKHIPAGESPTPLGPTPPATDS